MKRNFMGLLCSGAAVAALGVCGCGGGGMEEGLPKDTTPAVSPDMMKVNMATPGAKKPGPTSKPDAPKAP